MIIVLVFLFIYLILSLTLFIILNIQFRFSSGLVYPLRMIYKFSLLEYLVVLRVFVSFPVSFRFLPVSFRFRDYLTIFGSIVYSRFSLHEYSVPLHLFGLLPVRFLSGFIPV